MATDPSRTLAAAAAVALGTLAPAGARAEGPPVTMGETPQPALTMGETPKPPAAAAPKESAPPAPAEASKPDAPPKPTRRGGFMVGLNVGAGLGSIVGYPNDSSKIGFASAYTATGVRPASVIEGWLGGAFTDWFTFGIGFKSSQLFATDSNKARVVGGIFRVETFPLFALGGVWRDLGLRLDAGIGSASVTDAAGDKLVDSSSASIVGGGVFWEGLRAWKTRHGPFLMGDYLWSDTARRPAILLGWRSVLYTSP